MLVRNFQVVLFWVERFWQVIFRVDKSRDLRVLEMDFFVDYVMTRSTF